MEAIDISDPEGDTQLYNIIIAVTTARPDVEVVVVCVNTSAINISIDFRG